MKLVIDKIDSLEEISYKKFNVLEINSIQSKYPTLRQDSKAPTFALTYLGTYLTLMKNCGLTEQKAKKIEFNYHDMYAVSNNSVQSHIKEACNVGYITTGFGLRVRTPLLHKSTYPNLSSLASAESRTAGNALGQGWGVLNDRARNATLKRIDEANLSADILPVAAIHDANYYLIKNDVDILEWFNKVVTEETAWQNHELIKHDLVKLSGNLGIFYPDWSEEVTLPENATTETIITLCNNHKEKFNNG